MIDSLHPKHKTLTDISNFTHWTSQPYILQSSIRVSIYIRFEVNILGPAPDGFKYHKHVRVIDVSNSPSIPQCYQNSPSYQSHLHKGRTTLPPLSHTPIRKPQRCRNTHAVTSRDWSSLTNHHIAFGVHVLLALHVCTVNVCLFIVVCVCVYLEMNHS